MPGFINAQVGTLYYNGFWFPPVISMRVELRPVYDDRHLAVKYNNYVITVEFVIHRGVDDYGDVNDPVFGSRYNPFFPDNTGQFPTDPFNPIDDNFVLFRNVLARAHGPFLLNAKGIGILSANYPGSNVALPGGPYPQVLSWEPIGSNRSVRVVWRIEIGQALCVPNLARALSYQYDIMFDVDQMGLTTRTITGYFDVANPVAVTARQIGQTTLIGRLVTVTAEDNRYLGYLQFPVPLGFQRTSQSRRLSADRSRMDFQVVDTEVESDNPYPRGTTRVDIKSTTRQATSVLMPLGGVWQYTLDGTIEIAKGQPRGLAWLAFVRAVQDRLWRAENSGLLTTTDPDGGSPKIETSKLIIITDFQFAEDIYGRSSRFSVTWTFSSDLSTVLEASGMWRPLENLGAETLKGDRPAAASWSAWRDSMAEIWGPRAHAKLTIRPEDNVVVGVCDSVVFRHTESPGELPEKDNTRPLLSITKPVPEKSYLDYRLDVTRSENSQRTATGVLGGVDSYVRQPVTPRTVGPNPPPAPTATSPGDKATLESLLKQRNKALMDGDLEKVKSIRDQIDAIPLGSTNIYRPEIVQARSSAQYRVSMRGWAVRAGYEIPTPQLLTYGNTVPQPVGEGRFSQQVVSQGNGIPVYLAMWDFEYVLPTPPTGTGVAQVPAPTQWNMGALG